MFESTPADCAETGFIGLGAFAWLLLSFFHVGIKRNRGQHEALGVAVITGSSVPNLVVSVPSTVTFINTASF